MKRDIRLLLTHVEHKLQSAFHERPSRETLDRLALFVGFQDWESFCKETRSAENDEADACQKDECVRGDEPSETASSPMAETPENDIER